MIKYIAVSSLVMILMADKAIAGFQFTAPVQPANSQSQMIEGGLLPLVDNGENPPMPAVPKAPIVQSATPQIMVQPKTMTPVAVAPTPTSPAPIKASPTQVIWNKSPVAESEPSNDIAVGFGKNLPLVTALRQIIPSDHTYVLDTAVPTGVNVSWAGGREWNSVLNDSLSDVGLMATRNGKIVTVKPVMVEAPPVVMTEPAAVAEPIAMLEQPKVMIPKSPEPKTAVPAATKADLPVVQETIKGETVLREPTQGQWTARSGESLKTILEGWSQLENVDLFWSSDFDYPLVGDVNISGTYEVAVETLLQGFSTATPQPMGRLHPNLPHGPAVLIVETRQNNS